MRRIQLLLSGLVALTAVSMAAAAPLKAAGGGGQRDLIEALRSGGAQVVALGARGGLDGYFVTPAEGAGYSLYLTGDGHAVAGLLYGPDGIGDHRRPARGSTERGAGRPLGKPGRAPDGRGDRVTAHAAVRRPGAASSAFPVPRPCSSARRAPSGSRSASAGPWSCSSAMPRARGPARRRRGSAARRWTGGCNCASCPLRSSARRRRGAPPGSLRAPIPRARGSGKPGTRRTASAEKESPATTRCSTNGARPPFP